MSKTFFYFKTSWMMGAGLLVAICCIVYSPFFHNFFIWDDDVHVTQNPYLNDIDGLKRIWFDLRAMIQYYPLVWTSFWIEYQIWALDPLGYHLDNIIMHCINAVLLWRILSFLGVKGSWLAAAIFAIHPIQAESVAWVAERKNLLSGLFYFLSLYFFLHFYNPDKPLNFNVNQNGKRPWTLYVVSLFFFLCALWSKTVTSTLPAVILLIHWWKQNCIRKKIFLMMIPYFTLSLGFAGLTIQLEKFAGAIGPEWDFSFLDRLIIAGRALWFYIGKLVWPNPIIFTYPRWSIDDSIWWQYIYPVTFLFLIFLLWYWRKNIGRGPLTAILFFAGSLFPALGFFNVYPMRFSFVADHFQYLSGIGIIVIFSSGVEKITGDKKSLASFILLAALLTTLGKLTWNQGPVYENKLSLWKDTIKKNPKAWMAHNNLGVALVAEGKNNEEAISHYKIAIKLNPDFARPHNNLGNALLNKGRTSEAISHYKMAIKLNPGYAEAHYNLGVALFSEQNNEEAISHYKMAIKLNPDFARVHNNLGIALVAEGKNEEAISQYKMAIKLNPDIAEAHNNLGNALLKKGMTAEAISHYKMATKLNPEYVDAHYNLGITLFNMKMTEEAIDYFKEAIRIRPGFADAHNNLGVALFNMRMTEEAIDYFKEAIRIRPGYSAAQKNLETALLLSEELE